MSAILEVRQLSKQFPASGGSTQVKAVDGISFAVQPGTCFGLLGPNGAGKTTTLEMIEGITAPTAGEILYRGKARDKHFKLEAGFQFQETALPDYLTTAETLDLFAAFYPRTLDRKNLIELCDLGAFLTQRATRLSGGQRQRLLLALALLNDPALVFLDEPTTGLDPQSRRRFWHLVEDIKAQGKTVLLTTHYMDEAEYLCDHLVIMDHGRIIDEGSPRALLGKHFRHIKVCLDRHAIMGKHEGMSELIEFDESTATIQTESVEGTIQALMNRQVDLGTLSVHNPTLEDLFIKLTGHQLRS